VKKPKAQEKVQIKVLKPGELLLVRWRSSSYARQHMTAQQAHRQIRRNGSVPSPNPFYDGHSTPEDSYRLLNSES
jgi:hypothetical protein